MTPAVIVIKFFPVCVICSGEFKLMFLQNTLLTDAPALRDQFIATRVIEGDPVEVTRQVACFKFAGRERRSDRQRGVQPIRIVRAMFTHDLSAGVVNDGFVVFKSPPFVIDVANL
jgi:hypothetical protein